MYLAVHVGVGVHGLAGQHMCVCVCASCSCVVARACVCVGGLRCVSRKGSWWWVGGGGGGVGTVFFPMRKMSREIQVCPLGEPVAADLH